MSLSVEYSISVHKGIKNVCGAIIHIAHYVNDFMCQGYILFECFTKVSSSYVVYC